MTEDKKTSPVKDKKNVKKQTAPKDKKAQEDFKKHYFEFYDDIKISDRQDW